MLAGLKHPLQGPNTVVFAVRHVEDALVSEHPVRPSELAPHGVTVGTVATLTGAQNRIEYSGAQIQATDRMVLRVDDVQTIIGSRVGDPLGAVEGRHPSRTPIPRESSFAGARNTAQPPRGKVEPKHGITLAEHEVCVARAVGVERAWAPEGGTFERGESGVG